MTVTYYGPESYAMFGYESSYGTLATTLDIDFGKLVSATVLENDNPIRQVGVGEGRDEPDIVLGPFDVTGTIVFQLRHGRALVPAWGDVKTSGASDPYTHAIQKADGAGDLGVAADLLPSISIEVGKTTGSTDDVKQIVGCYVRTCRISGAIGQPIVVTIDFVGQKPIVDTTAHTYTASSENVFVVSQSNATWGGVGLGLLESFDFTIDNSLQIYRNFGNRFISEPTPGRRAHNFSATLSAQDAAIFRTLRDDFYGQSASSGPVDGTGATKSTKALLLEIIKEAANKEVELSLPTAVIDSWNEPIEGQNRVVCTVNGHSKSSTCTTYDGLDDTEFV